MLGGDGWIPEPGEIVEWDKGRGMSTSDSPFTDTPPALSGVVQRIVFGRTSPLEDGPQVLVRLREESYGNFIPSSDVPRGPRLSPGYPCRVPTDLCEVPLSAVRPYSQFMSTQKTDPRARPTHRGHRGNGRRRTADNDA